jgi:hypothetical protein
MKRQKILLLLFLLVRLVVPLLFFAFFRFVLMMLFFVVHVSFLVRVTRLSGRGRGRIKFMTEI